MNIKLVEHLQTLNEEDLFPNASKEDIADRRLGKLVSEIHGWINLEVSQEQLESVLWAIMMSRTEDEVVEYVRNARFEHDEEIRRDFQGETNGVE